MPRSASRASEVAAGSPPSDSPGPSEPPATSEPTDTSTPSEAPATQEPTPVLADFAIVPVAQFRTTRTATDREEVEAVLAGRSTRYQALELVEADADAILAALELEPPAASRHLILAKDAKTFQRHLAKNRKRLGFLRAEQVRPGVRALGWGKRTLFGVDRITDPGEWRLTAHLEVADGDGHDGLRPVNRRGRMFAGGDVLLDRGVTRHLDPRQGRGLSVRWGLRRDHRPLLLLRRSAHPVPDDAAHRRQGGDAGPDEVGRRGDRELREPGPEHVPLAHQRRGLLGGPTHIEGLVRAGLDYVSIANNHIGDAGRNGMLQTIAQPRPRRIKPTRARARTSKAARKPAIIDDQGPRSRSSATTRSPATTTRHGEPGSAPLTRKNVKEDWRGPRRRARTS